MEENQKPYSILWILALPMGAAVIGAIILAIMKMIA